MMGIRILSREEAEPILQPFLNPIFRCIQDGWRDFLSIDPAKIQSLEIRTRAGLIRDFTVAHVKRLAFSQDGMSFGAKEGHLLIGSGSNLLIQFKKLADGLAVANYQTERRRQFDAQMPLEGVASATRLTAGYIPDDLWTKPRELYVVCHCGKVQEWYLRVNLFDNTLRKVDYFRLPFEEKIPAKVIREDSEKKGRIRKKSDVIRIGIKRNE
ncbi:MAG: hypothetical protein PHH28_14705 [Desulfuromonadaceae bacterium]|nr:hypothetical protein [Desulfuromonadaceae bacterium]